MELKIWERTGKGEGGGLIYFMEWTRHNDGEAIRSKLAMGRNLHKPFIVLNPESVNDSWVDFFFSLPHSRQDG